MLIPPGTDVIVLTATGSLTEPMRFHPGLTLTLAVGNKPPRNGTS